MDQEGLPMSDDSVKVIYESQNNAQAILHHLGYHVTDSSVLSRPSAGLIRVSALAEVISALYDV